MRRSAADHRAQGRPCPTQTGPAARCRTPQLRPAGVTLVPLTRDGIALPVQGVHVGAVGEGLPAGLLHRCVCHGVLWVCGMGDIWRSRGAGLWAKGGQGPVYGNQATAMSAGVFTESVPSSAQRTPAGMHAHWLP